MKTKKTIYIVIAILVVLGLGWYGFKKYGEIGHFPKDAPEKSAIEQNSGKDSLTGFILPVGFSLSIFAKDLPDARVIETDPKGRLLVTETKEGKIVALSDTNNDHVSDTDSERKVLATDLNKPHGMAMNCAGGPCFLYVAEQNALDRFSYDAEALSLGPKENLISIDSASSDRHFSRSLLFLPAPNEDTLLISVGSSCDVCNEKDADHASILSYNIKTGEKKTYSKGLRNATFLALNPVSGKVYATEMGRDDLGDDVPPDEINIIEQKSNQPQNYGWPICYGKNIHDDKFDKNTYIRNPCMEPFEIPSFIDLQAHSAPLGLDFIPEEGWPEQYWHNLLVAYHGSWNRSTPTGYKISRIKMNAKGEYLGTEDFISGWLTNEGKKTGRPVDIKILSGGVAYISDDDLGVIYRLAANK